jgi:ribonuclease HI
MTPPVRPVAPEGDPQDGIFTDGSATPNPGPGGWAAVRVSRGAVVAEISGADPATTNNRMELTALLRAIDLVPEGSAEVLYSDSQLAVRTVNEWALSWEARGWRRSRGPVENLDLVRPLYEALRGRPELEVRWIRAHVGHRWNEYADRLASRASAAR